MQVKKNIKKYIFRGYDIRGVFDKDIDVDTAYTIGLGFGSKLYDICKDTCVVGHDNRLSSPDLHQALIQGLIETGINVIDLGLCTTPMFYFACLDLKIDSGIMITASHNPKDENGFKFAFSNYQNAKGKEIEDFYDFIKKGLVSAKISSLTGSDKGYLVNFVFKDNSRKTLKVIQRFGCTATDLEEAQDICLNRGIGINDSDKFSISYGPDGNLVEYPLPDLGHEVIPGLGGGGVDHTVYSLKINEVNISSKDRIFSLHITLSHPDLGSDYSINIVTPLNYP